MSICISCPATIWILTNRFSPRYAAQAIASTSAPLTTQHSVTNWYRVQIDFPGLLDEAFGVASNKQGVRMKEYVLDKIREENPV